MHAVAHAGRAVKPTLDASAALESLWAFIDERAAASHGCGALRGSA